jgi:hypothetical protein
MGRARDRKEGGGSVGRSVGPEKKKEGRRKEGRKEEEEEAGGRWRLKEMHTLIRTG